MYLLKRGQSQTFRINIQLGMDGQRIDLDENGYIMATLPSNTNKDVPVLGFLEYPTTPNLSCFYSQV